MKRIFFLILLFLSSLSVYAQELTVVYTAKSNGKLMYCNCPGDPYGGLSERVTLIKDLRKKEGDFLLVDAGDAVGLFGDYDLKASCVYRMMNMMRYDVAAAGRNEVYRGIPRLQAAARVADFPIVSASFADSVSGKPLFTPYAMKKVGSVTVAVTALCDTSIFTHVIRKAFDYKLLDPHEALGDIIGPMSRDSDFVIVLSQMAPETNAALLDTFPAIDLIVEAHNNKPYDPPIVKPDGVIVCPGTHGEQVGLVTLRKTGGAIDIARSELIPVKDIPEDPKAHEIVVEYYRERK